MRFSGYVAGVVGLIKDLWHFVVFLLKRPHYVALILAVILGAFYIAGISPQEIPVVLNNKWQRFVKNRKQTISEDLYLFSKRFDDPDNPLKQTISIITNNLSEKPDKTVEEKKQAKPVFIVPPRRKKETLSVQKNASTPEQQKNEDEKILQGTLFIEGADKIKINTKKFLLKVKLRPGKSSEAFSQLNRRFNGANAKCYPDPKHPQYADCFVGSLDVSELLIDFGYADPL